MLRRNAALGAHSDTYMPGGFYAFRGPKGIWLEVKGERREIFPGAESLYDGFKPIEVEAV